MMGAIFGTRVYLSGGGFSEQRKSPSAVGRVRGIATINDTPDLARREPASPGYRVTHGSPTSGVNHDENGENLLGALEARAVQDEINHRLVTARRDVIVHRHAHRQIPLLRGHE